MESVVKESMHAAQEKDRLASNGKVSQSKRFYTLMGEDEDRLLHGQEMCGA